MRPLAEVQQAFARAIYLGADANLAFEAGPIAPEEALRVHRNTVMGALVGALRLTYPTVDRLVGEAFFDQAAVAFAENQPPSNARLANYGGEFPGFLQSYVPASGLAYLADVARLDAAIDTATLGPGDSVRITFPLDDNVSISLPEGLRVLALTYPVDLIKDALDADDDTALGAIDLLPNGRWLVLWRIERKIVVKLVSPEAGMFLRMFLGWTPASRALAAAAAYSSIDAATQEIQRDVFTASFCQVETHTGD